ncbi:MULTISPECIES: hypothetical protein [unclassified Gemella]|uniref:hypothetical protein n=1 Tax=unclassified Gemella TaxID=2624949 RepID=UPI0010742050|nr:MULTISPECIES: hypothetical protein [unclassified Gemella]MBF0709764.1 hypothetical protein [Gemella sp. GL1.1]MBF0747148.1 hypothetical protein [Gemella sp. 19428wG2_WT2a]NYS27108.1 hypothetical protein [Gemella sp. GL1]TFU58388.1 hypothetical protein E4T67_05735 [Gemella sp. WT2a]
MNNDIIGKVIKIINSDTLIIHTPYKNVKRGDNIAIVASVFPIINPDDDTLLGNYYVEKEHLEVVSNHDLYVVAQKIIRRKPIDLIDIGADHSYIKSIKLNVLPEENEKLKSTDTRIRLGDLVIFQK